MKTMKYVVFWEYDKEDEAVLLEKFKTRPETEINRLFPPMVFGGQTKGFSLVEEEDFDRVEKFCHHYTPVLEFEILPIVEAVKMIEIRKY